MKQKVNILLAGGGAGDLLCALVAVDYNIRHYDNCTFYTYVPDYLLEFARHVLPNEAIVRSYTKAKSKYDASLPGVTTQWNNSFHTAMRTHPLDYSFHVLTDKHIYDINEKNYLKINPERIHIERFELPEKYVVFACAAVVPVKEIPVSTMNQIIDYVLAKGYVPVFLGKTFAHTGYGDVAIQASPIDINFNKGFNLLNKTSLLEAAKIIHGAKAFIGADGGLMHLAGFTDTEILASFTLASPTHLAPIRNGSQTYKFHAIEPDDMSGKYYQTNTNFNFDEDMRFFDGWEKVRDSITADKFIKVLEEIL
jgi:ADP-heptose:LPS heptosyltransferase